MSCHLACGFDDRKPGAGLRGQLDRIKMRSQPLSHAICELFRLEGRTPLSERRAILQRLHTGQTRVVANCAVLTEGFDEPSVDCIIMARPTRSRPLYQQMLGRGTRTYPGKSDCLVLDVVGVSTRHTLQTVSTLFGCSPDDLDSQSVTEMVAERQRREREHQEAIEGRLRSTPVNLFARRQLRWVQTRQGASASARLSTPKRRAISSPRPWA